MLRLARNWKVLLVAPNPALAEGLRTLFNTEAPTAEVFEVKSYPDLSRLPQLLHSQPLSICFLDCHSNKETSQALIGEMLRVLPRLAIVAVLEKDDPDLILRCIRQGAAEFITPPFHAAHMEQTAVRLSRTYPDLIPPAGTCRVTTVMPAKGACGASTVAVNLAFQRKKLGAKRLLLADLDPLTGSVSFMLKARSVYSFLDAMARGTSLDVDIWKGLVQTVDGVELLVAPDQITETLYALGDPTQMIEFARGIYDRLIIDAASPYGAWNLRLAAQSDEILLTSTSSPPALRAAGRAITYLTANQIPQERIRVIVNRQAKDTGVSTERIREEFGLTPGAILPADADSIQRALIDGKPAPPGSPFQKSISALAQALNPQPATLEEPAQKGTAAELPGWKRMFGTLLGKR